MIIGLVSCYREGRLLLGAARSAAAGCHLVGVFEGPIGKVADWKDEGLPSPLAEAAKLKRVIVAPNNRQGWASEAEKRSYMLEWAKGKHATNRQANEPLWVLWVDGDEVLMWGEHLIDWCDRAQGETGAGGFSMRIVELDGSVALAHGRIFQAHYVQRFLVAASQVELTGGVVVTMPNEKVCRAGGVPWGAVPMRQLPDQTIAPVGADSDEMEMFLARHRPPLAGEPHILHRSMLRDPKRGVQRMHEAEGESFRELTGGNGGRTT